MVAYYNDLLKGRGGEGSDQSTGGEVFLRKEAEHRFQENWKEGRKRVKKMGVTFGNRKSRGFPSDHHRFFFPLEKVEVKIMDW